MQYRLVSEFADTDCRYLSGGLRFADNYRYEFLPISVISANRQGFQSVALIKAWESTICKFFWLSASAQRLIRDKQKSLTRFSFLYYFFCVLRPIFIILFGIFDSMRIRVLTYWTGTLFSLCDIYLQWDIVYEIDAKCCSTRNKMLPLARLSSLTKASADLGSTEQSICRMSSLLETIEATEVPLAHTPSFLAPVKTRRTADNFSCRPQPVLAQSVHRLPRGTFWGFPHDGQKRSKCSVDSKDGTYNSCFLPVGWQDTLPHIRRERDGLGRASGLSAPSCHKLSVTFPDDG